MTQDQIFNLWNQCLPDWPISVDQLFSRLNSGKTIFIEDKGLINYQFKNSQGQITIILVDPKFQLQGLGTKLLNSAIEDLRQNYISEILIGCGVGGYFWPGIPHNLPTALKFFQKNNYQENETNLEMLLNLQNYQTPAQLKNIIIESPKDKTELLNFENINFPNWTKFFETADLKNILITKQNDEITGSVVLISPDNFTWSKLLPNTGGFGAIGVAKKYRGQGIGLALAAKTTEVLKSRGLNNSFLGWTYLDKWYGQLGYKIWQKYSYGKICL